MARFVISPEWVLTKEDVQKALDNARRFATPLVLLYIATVIPQIQPTVELSDFAITPALLSAMVLYILNFLNDLFLKWKESNRYVK